MAETDVPGQGAAETRPVSDFISTMRTTLRDATKLKSVMQKRGLRRAQAKCPECGGMLQGALVGKRDHMRFWCTGTCKRQLME